MNDRDVEARLRESLHRNALGAPPGDLVAERVLHRLDRQQLQPRRRWRGWALPLAVAAAVGIAGTVIALAQVEHDGSARVVSQPPARTGSPVPTTSSTTARSSLSTGTTPSSGTATSRSTATAALPEIPAGLLGVHILDVAFTSAENGWLLASTDCADPTSGGEHCAALLSTDDGGHHWVAANAPSAHVGGIGGCTSAAPCVEHILFANKDTGYAFGPDVLLLTTDGGHTWTRLDRMGADALEILGNTVILVRAVRAACPQRCPLFETSPVGSTRWTPFSVTDPPVGATAVTLSGHGNHAELLLSSVDLAKGSGSDQDSALYVSSDAGRHWIAKGEPCPYIGAGYTDQTVAMTTSSDGAIVIDCATRSGDEPNFIGGLTITSTDHGEHFVAPAHGGKLGPARVLAAASAAVQLAYAGSNGGAAQLYRSTNGGDSWSAVQGLSGEISWIGFQSATVGRMLSEDGRTLWTTRDAGMTWTGHTFR